MSSARRVTNEVIHEWMPFDVMYKADAPAGQRMRIRGIISTEHEDLQGETVVQAGMDLMPIESGRGWFNDNHKRQTGAALGVPEKVWPTTVKGSDGNSVKATMVEGYLLDTPDGRKVWEAAKALKGTGRSLGFSVEGGIIERDPANEKRITKSVVREIAITRCPVNPHTRLEPICKSLTALLDKALSVGSVLPANVGSTQPGALAPAIPQDLARRPNIQMFGDTPWNWDAYFSDWARPESEPATPRRVSRAEAIAVIRKRRPKATTKDIGAVLAAARRNQNG